MARLQPQRQAPHETNSELCYAAQGCSLKALAVLSLGLFDADGSPTFNPSKLSWSAALKQSTLKMIAKELHAKVVCHVIATKNVLSVPHPAALTVLRATEWLVANLITAEAEVAFLRGTISHCIAVAEHA